MSVTINATVMYAALNKPNDMSSKYQVELCELSPKAVRALEEMGLTVKNNPDKPEKGDYIACRSTRPIFAYDVDGDVIDGSIVGNGSKCAANVGTYEWSFQKKSGISPALNRLVITDLVIYDGGAGGEVDLDEAL